MFQNVDEIYIVDPVAIYSDDQLLWVIKVMTNVNIKRAFYFGA